MSIGPARALLLLSILVVLLGCSTLFFYPYRHHVLVPTQLGLVYQDVYFNSSKGLVLHGWWLPAEGYPLATVLFLHGNAENISTHIDSIFWLPAAHFNVFLFDYRGYGASQGKPTIPGVIEDVESALRTLSQRSGIDTHRLVLIGQSLGGALALYIAAHSAYRAHLRAVISDSAFSSYRLIAREKFAAFWPTWLFQWPLSWTVSDVYSPLSAILKVSPIPVLIVHGDRDRIVPVHHALRIYEAAQEPKQLWILPEVAHIQSFKHRDTRERLVRYLQDRLGEVRN